MPGKPIISAFGTLIVSALLTATCASSTRAQRRHPPKAPNNLLATLDQDDRHCVQQSGLDKSVAVTPIQLAVNRRRQILVRGSGLCLCGAQNCAFWIYQKTGQNYELLLKGTGSTKVEAVRASAKGYRNVVSESHASASETIVRTYRYDGSRYQLLTCVNRAYYDDNGKYTTKPTNRPCGDEDPGESSTKVPANILAQELTTIDNRKLKLSDYSDRVLVVSLFASCVPCRSNIPDLNILDRNLKNEVQVIGVVAREDDKELEPLRQFTQVLKVNFPVVWQDIGFTDSLSNLVPGLHVLPQTFIIDREGRIRKHFRGFDAKDTPALVREALDQVRAKDAMRTR
jgi:peroxiredoxin